SRSPTTRDAPKGTTMRLSFIPLGAMFAFSALAGLPSSATADETLTGLIKQVTVAPMPIKGGTKDVVANILLDGYSVHITKETIIVCPDAGKARVANRKVGRRVSARMPSDIADTAPPQIHTDVIVIQVGAGPPEKQKPKR